MANKLKVARKLFQDLKLDNWRESKDTLTPGAQAAVLVVEREDGSKGVFRCLGNEDPKAIARFHRELQILTDPEFRHPSIIKLLDYTKDEKPWYITSANWDSPLRNIGRNSWISSPRTRMNWYISQ
jgi:hypothetical protein